MKLTNDAKTALQDMKDEAEDLCYEAREQAGLSEEKMTESTDVEECVTE